MSLWVSERPGRGPLIVMVHGSMDRSASFIRTERKLAGRNVLRYDRRGYGRSTDLPVATAFDDHVDDLLAVIDGRPAVVIGHSLGGVVALTAAQREPALVRAVGAFEAPMPWADWWPPGTAGGAALAGAADPADAAETFMRRLIGDERWEELPGRTRKERRAEGVALVAEMRFLHDPPPPYDPSRITVPVVAARGGTSIAHHVRTAEELARAVPGAELVVIDGAGHGAHASHPTEFAAYVERVVASVDRDGPPPV